MENIVLTGDNGEEITLYVLEETQLSGNKYMLVCDDPDGDGEATIMKAVAEDGQDIVYEFVEDDLEFDAVAKLFEELVGEDADFE